MLQTPSFLTHKSPTRGDQPDLKESRLEGAGDPRPGLLPLLAEIPSQDRWQPRTLGQGMG